MTAETAPAPAPAPDTSGRGYEPKKFSLKKIFYMLRANGLTKRQIRRLEKPSMPNPEEKSLTDVFDSKVTVDGQTFKLGNGVFFSLKTHEERDKLGSVKLKLRLVFSHNPKAGEKANRLQPVILDYELGEPIELNIDGDTKVRIMNVDMGNGVYSLVVESTYLSTRMNGEVKEVYQSTKQVYLMREDMNGSNKIVHLEPKNNRSDAEAGRSELNQKGILGREIEFPDLGIICKVEKIIGGYYFDFKEEKIKAVQKVDGKQPCFRFIFTYSDPTLRGESTKITAAFGNNPKLIVFDEEKRIYITSLWDESIETDANTITGKKIIEVAVVQSLVWRNGIPAEETLTRKVYFEIKKIGEDYSLETVQPRSVRTIKKNKASV